MEIGLTEQLTGVYVFYMEPPSGESHHRSHKFPAMLVVTRDEILAMTPGARGSVDHINHLSVVNTGYVVVGPEISLVDQERERKKTMKFWRLTRDRR